MNNVVIISGDEYRELVRHTEKLKMLAKYVHSNKYNMPDMAHKVIFDMLDAEVSANE